MKRLFLFPLIVLFSTAPAQTKRIEHRSHSGSNKTFDLRNSSNFGIVPSFSKEDKRKMDSLYLSRHYSLAVSKQKYDSIVRSDSILQYWYDSLARTESLNGAHANEPVQGPKPGQGLGAGAGAAIGITRK